MFLFFQYTLESGLCLAVLLLPYLAWFRKMTFHQWNRFYLLGAIFFSLSAPLVNIEIKTTSTPEIIKLKEDFQLFEEIPTDRPITKIENSPSKIDDITVYKQPKIDVSPSESAFASWDVSDFLLSVYFLGFPVFMGMSLYRLAKLFKLIDKGNKTQEHGFIAVHLPGKQVFSFFHFVFFDHNRYDENEKQTLIGHERVHIQQWHSLDLVFLEILQVLFWFNPLYHFYMKLLQQEHEYFVDAIISKDLGQPLYAKLLLSLSTQRAPFVGHAFAYIPIKHRIFKLLQKPSTTMEKSKFLIVFPIFITLLFTFSCSVEELNSSNISEVTTSNGKKVSKIKTFFIDEQSSVHQESEAITIFLNEDGTIADTEIKQYPILTEEIPEYDWSEVYSLFKQSPTNNFLLKNVQWLIGEDADIKPICLKAILYSSNGDLLKDIDKTFTTKKVKLNPLESENESLMKRMKIFENETLGEDSVIEESSNGEIKYWSKFNRSVKRDIQTNSLGKIEQILNTSKHAHTWHNKKIERDKIQASGFDMHKNIVKLDVFFEENGSIAEMKYDYTYEIKYEYSYGINDDGKHSSEEKYGNIYRFINDENGRVKTLEILDTEGISSRKYQFHYNKAGYCTKKELINQEGIVASSVRFEYDFYN